MSLSKDDFPLILAGAIHDIKNTLSRINHLSDDIQTDLESLQAPPELIAKQQRLTRSLFDTRDRLSGLLIYYKICEETLSLMIDEHSILPLIEEAASVYQEDSHPSLTITTDIQEASGFFDKELLLLCLNNLLDNAARFAKSSISIEVRSTTDGLYFSVLDDGPGIDDLPSLQEALNNEELPAVGNHTGFGLLFCKRIAESHHNKDQQGQLTIESLDHGTRVNLIIP